MGGWDCLGPEDAFAEDIVHSPTSSVESDSSKSTSLSDEESVGSHNRKSKGFRYHAIEKVCVRACMRVRVLCLCVCSSVCVCACVCAHMHVCVCPMSVCLFVCAWCVCCHVCLFICTYARVYVSVCLCVCLSLCVCVVMYAYLPTCVLSSMY